MQTDQKTIVEETRRWLRVGTLTLTVLGPFVNTLISQLQKRLSTPREKVSQRQPMIVDTQKKLVTIGDALTETVQDLKNRPSSPELLKNIESLTRDLQDHVTTLFRSMPECREQTTYTLNKSNNNGMQDLVKRAGQLSKTLTEIRRRATHKITESKNTRWVIAGFSIGLIAASIATYFFIRQRSQHNKEHIELADSAQLYVRTGQAVSTSQLSNQEAKRLPPQHMSFTAIAEPAEQNTTRPSPPEGTRVVAIVSTRHYYPIETALDLLASSLQGEDLEIIYFASPEEAEAQGFSATN